MWYLVALLSALAPLSLALGQNQPEETRSNGKASISITGVPHAGEGGPGSKEPISGKVTGVECNKHKVVVYVLAGGTWWVQPTVASPFTDIDDNGKWETDTHLGSTYAALLVKPSFKALPTTDALPSAHGDVVAVVRVAGTK